MADNLDLIGNLEMYANELHLLIKCKSCESISPTGLLSLVCGHLSCPECIDAKKSCPECDYKVKPKDIHKSDFLESVQKYIEELNDLFIDERPKDVTNKKLSFGDNGQDDDAIVTNASQDKKVNGHKDDEGFIVPSKIKTPSKIFAEELVAAGIVDTTEAKNRTPEASPVRTSGRTRKPKILDDEDDESQSKKPKMSPRVSQKTKSLEKISSKSKSMEKIVQKDSKSISKAQKIGLLGTALNEKQKQLLVRFANEFGGKVYDDWNDKVTHVVGAVEINNPNLTTRTLKYMKGLLGNKWMVSISWIENSIKKKKVLEEEEFELVGTKKQDVKNHGAPSRSRLSDCRLFDHVTFYFDGKFHGKDGMPDVDDLSELVQLGGGKVLNSKSSKKSFVTVVEDDKKLSKDPIGPQITVKQLFSFIENFDPDSDIMNI